MTWLVLYASSNLFRIYVIGRFIRALQRKCRVTRRKELLVYGSFYVVNTVLFLTLHLSWVNLLCNLIGMGVITLLYTNSVRSIVFTVGSFSVITMACDVLGVLLVSDYEEGKPINPVCQLIAVFTLFICELLAEKIIKPNRKEESAQNMTLLLVPVCSVLVNVILMYSNSITDEGLIVVNLGFLLINFLTFYLYDMLSEALYQKYKNVALQQQIQSYSNQMKVVMKSEEKVKGLRHDIKHHMNEIKLMASQGKNGDIQKYIDSMQEYMSNPEELVKSGNWEVDSILNYMLQQAKTELNSVQVNVELPETLKYSFDMNVVFGNLLENAIEGARRTKEKQMNVDISFQKGVLRIEIENSYDGKLKQGEDKLLTTKVDKELHGIGLSNVKKVVEKYQGIMEIYPKKGAFCITVIMYI